MTITSQAKVASQTIDGVVYAAGEEVILKPNAVITTNYSDEYETTRSPDLTKPSDVEMYGDTYTFSYWYLEDDPTGGQYDQANIKAISGFDTELNNEVFKASWMTKHDGYGVLHVITNDHDSYQQYTLNY